MTEKLAAEIVKKSGIMRDTGMTSATPKPRAGEHIISTEIENVISGLELDMEYHRQYGFPQTTERLQKAVSLIRALAKVQS